MRFHIRRRISLNIHQTVKQGLNYIADLKTSSGLWRREVPEDRGSKVLRNVGIPPQHYTQSMEAARISETMASYRNTTPWRRRQ
jgi:hypothetical protein